MNNLRQYSDFIFINALMAMVWATRYFLYFPDTPYEWIQSSYTVAAVIGHFALLTILLALPLLLFLALPKKVFGVLSSIWFILAWSLLVIDSTVYEFYRFHINMAILQMFAAGQVIEIPLVAWLALVCVLLVGVGLQYTLWGFIDKHRARFKRLTKYGWVSIFVCIVYSQGISIWANATGYQKVKVVDLYLPLYHPTTANSLLSDWGWIDLQALQQKQAQAPQIKTKLAYPVRPLVVQPPQHKTNIILILIDSWRIDSLSQEVMPNLYKASQQGISFANHISSGNATRMGTFGLFYGLPGPYWKPILANKKPTLLLDSLQQQGYQLGIFASAQLAYPEFSQTIFAGVENLRMGSNGATPAIRDQQVLQDWQRWYSQQNNRHHFSFLFFDSLHGYDFPDDYQHKFEPMSDANSPFNRGPDVDSTPLKNRYYTAAHYVDNLIAQVFDTLRQQDKFADSLIIVTGDHGEAFNDYGKNYWGHGSNFTPVQTRVPFIVLGKHAQQLQQTSKQLTSHYDLVPSIMQQFLGVTNDPKDYSIGQNLFTKGDDRQWNFVTDYNNYGLVDDEGAFSINVSGLYRHYDNQHQPQSDKKLDSKKMAYIMEVMSRFQAKEK
ncbi:DUF3413 domain-containing protein [Paraferrimonas sp. SM1919]|uniref:DUF3413 domain-containing protein n=1 Tax=Paraferrimonas sp. SM1919 TaxID=2662263 RepID=UPI0013D6C832|nr:DUF3413 domain-containing protein [Paraferrimonas sp. SM1919]